MKFKYNGVLPPEPNVQNGITISWNLGFRAVVSTERSPQLNYDEKTGFYKPIFDKPIFDFHELPEEKIFQIELCIQKSAHGHGYDMFLPAGEMIVLGLGLRMEFAQDWVVGLISLRRQWLLKGLTVVNSNNPIYGNTTEVVAFLRNMSPLPVRLTWHSRPFQVHFHQVMVSPEIECERWNPIQEQAKA